MRFPVFVGGCIDLSSRPSMGILAFEVATAMARLISLHRTLADDHFLLLSDNMSSLGVANFFSTDQSFLLRLACAELVADLDTVSATVARFSLKCRDPLLRGFDRFYGNVKASALRHGFVAEMDRLGLGSMAKSVEKQIKKMQKYVASTSRLQEELHKLEGSEKTQNSEKFPKQRKQELRTQRLNIRRLKERSLWSWTFDEVVQPMAVAVITVFERICAVLGPQVLSSPPLPPARNHGSILLLPGARFNFFNTVSSGMLDRPSLAAKDVPITNEMLTSLEAGLSTVGGSGLSFHYAELIVIAEFLFACWELYNAVDAGLIAMRQIATAVRDVVCHKMTRRMRCTVTAKLEEIRQRKKDGTEMSSMETDWWGNELERILGWLVPLACNTGRWEEQSEQRFFVGPRVLLSHTLHFADRNLTETAIVAVFVGLSYLSYLFP